MRRSLIHFLATLVVLVLLAIRFSDHIAFLKWKFDNHVYRIQFERRIRKELGIIPYSKRITGSYLAPLNGCDDNSTRMPHKYSIFLRHGYTLEEHQQAIDVVDWDSAISRVFPEGKTYGGWYSVTMNDTGLAAVRADVGVDNVECNRKIILEETVVADDVAGTVGDWTWDGEAGYVLMIGDKRVDDGESWSALFEEKADHSE